MFFICCTLLALTVGPASALLFVPTQLWIKSSSTRFYMSGVEDDLWPAVLSRNHTGPEACAVSPLRRDYSSCLYASWTVLLGGVTVLRLKRPGFSFYIPGGDAYFFPPASLITGNVPDPNDYTKGEPDTWAVGPDLGVASHMDYLNELTVEAFGKSTRWRARLKDVGGSRLVLTEGGRFPITRTVCSDRTAVTGPQSMLDIPVVEEHRLWRERVHEGKGLMAHMDLASMNLTDWNALQLNATTTLQSRAKWLSLPPNLGFGSAILVRLVQNQTATYAHTCVVDSRWAKGQTMDSDRSIMWSWESQPGVQKFDPHDAKSDWTLQRNHVSMFDAQNAAFFKPIRMEQSWLDALAPDMPEASLPGNDLVMTSYEALLNQSGLPKADQHGTRDETTLLEYVPDPFLSFP